MLYRWLRRIAERALLLPVKRQAAPAAQETAIPVKIARGGDRVI
jgi:hypothetical protein